MCAMSHKPSFLPAALSGDRVEFDSRAGRLSAYVAGTGPPLLLIHSINAVASAAEVRPLYEHYATRRTVVAVDLPGYGFSERSDRVYSPRLMTDALHAVIDRIHARVAQGPVDALALSLSSEFLARAAWEKPGSFRSLAFVSPTGLNGARPYRGKSGSTRALPGAHALLRGPGWGRWLFRLLTRPGVIRYFLRRTWGRAQIDERLRRYNLLTARQPGAHYAPLYFLSGGLFSGDIDRLYESITPPVWMSRGTRGDFTEYRQEALVRARRNWRFGVFTAGALPFFEVPAQFCAAYDEFLAERAVHPSFDRAPAARSSLRLAADRPDRAPPGIHELQDQRSENQLHGQLHLAARTDDDVGP
jgi:pimeloyl-ACP methyl ester carboxylesterase